MLFLLIGILLLRPLQDADLEALSRELDELYRAGSSHGAMTMKVTTPHYNRTLSMEVWSLGMDHTLVRILSPSKEKGTSTLKRDTEMWNYLPKIEKLIRIPPSMMMGSWMGSDFTNDDLMRESTWSEDYQMTRGPDEEGLVVAVFEPKPEAPVTWQRVEVRFDKQSRLPVQQVYFDEKGRRARVMVFDEVKVIGGRRIPSRITLTPLLKEGYETQVVYTEMAFDIALDPSFFSKAQMKRER